MPATKLPVFFLFNMELCKLVGGFFPTKNQRGGSLEDAENDVERETATCIGTSVKFMHVPYTTAQTT